MQDINEFNKQQLFLPYLEDHFNTDVPNSFFRSVLNFYNNYVYTVAPVASTQAVPFHQTGLFKSLSKYSKFGSILVPSSNL